MNGLFKYRYRLFFDTYLHESLGFNGQLNDPVLQQFEEHVLQQDAMRHGRYHSMAIYPYGEQKYNSETILFERKYHSGRVVWGTDATINMYTLRTGVTKQYLKSGHEDFCTCWLNQDILVIQARE